MPWRGVSLIEMLIALALLAAILALVTPPLAERFAERSFEAAQTEVQAHLALARAEAMTTGAPREVRFLPDPGRLVIMPFDPRHRLLAEEGPDAPGQSIRSAGGRRLTGGSNEDRAAEFDFDPGADPATSSWSRLDLPSGVAFRDEPPGEPAGTDSRFAELTDAALVRSLRVAVFLSDGSVLAGRDLWFTDADGRAVRLIVNPWTGLTRFDRYVPAIEPESDPVLAGMGGSPSSRDGSPGRTSP